MSDERRAAIFDEIDAERQKQDAKWGEQDHPMVPPDVAREAEAHFAMPSLYACAVLGIEEPGRAREVCDREHKAGRGSYTHILVEEVAEFVEACVEHGETSDEARAELVQTVAVGVAMIEALDRKRAAVAR